MHKVVPVSCSPRGQGVHSHTGTFIGPQAWEFTRYDASVLKLFGVLVFPKV